MGGLQDVLNQCDVVEAALGLARMCRGQGLHVYLAEPDVAGGHGAEGGYVQFDAVIPDAGVASLRILGELLLEAPEQAFLHVQERFQQEVDRAREERRRHDRRLHRPARTRPR